MVGRGVWATDKKEGWTMAVFILGGGASCCTNAYGEDGRGLLPRCRSEKAKRDFRPPVMKRVFGVAMKNDLFDRSPWKPILEKILGAPGVTLDGLAKRGAALEDALSNVETVLSMLDELAETVHVGPDQRPSHLGAAPDMGDVLEILRGDPARGVELLAEIAAAGLGGIGLQEVLFARDALLTSVELVYGPTEPYEGHGDARECENYRAFVEKLRPGDTIVTFNYDFLLDRILEERGGWGTNNDEALPVRFRIGDGEGKYLKLHGSVLWYVRYEGRDAHVRFLAKEGEGRPPGGVHFEPFTAWLDEVKHGWRGLRQERHPHDRSELGDVEPLIVAPTYRESWRPEVKKLWDMWEAELRSPDLDELYVIGYSFPPTDEHVEKAIRSREGGYSGVVVKIVTKGGNEEVAQLNECVARKFKGAKQVRVECDKGFGQWVKSWWR